MGSIEANQRKSIMLQEEQKEQLQKQNELLLEQNEKKALKEAQALEQSRVNLANSQSNMLKKNPHYRQLEKEKARAKKHFQEKQILIDRFKML